MRLLIINDCGISGGGAENRIRLLAEHFLETGFCEEIHLIESNSSDSKHGKIKIHKCGKSRIESFLLTFKIIRNYGIDLVQVHNLLLVKPECVLAARLLGKKVVWFFHDWWLLCAKRTLFDGKKACLSKSLKTCGKCIGLKEKIVMALNRFCINLCDAGNASTRFAKKILEKNGILQKKIFVTMPWIDPVFFSVKRRKSENIIVFVGSLEYYKGAFILAKAMKKVLQKIPGAKLFFVGAGQESEKRREIEEIGMADGSLKSFVFLGKKSHKEFAVIFETAGCLVCPSIWPEPTGTVWMEAGAAGVPVIASSIGGIPEIFPKKEFLFGPGKQSELAKLIVKAIKSSPDRQFFKRMFDLEKNVMEIKQKYLLLFGRQKTN